MLASAQLQDSEHCFWIHWNFAIILTELDLEKSQTFSTRHSSQGYNAVIPSWKNHDFSAQISPVKDRQVISIFPVIFKTEERTVLNLIAYEDSSPPKPYPAPHG